MEKGVIVTGQVFSDCLVPSYIEAINRIIDSGQITYDVAGMKNLCSQLRSEFADQSANEMNATLRGQYTEELEQWLVSSI